MSRRLENRWALAGPVLLAALWLANCGAKAPDHPDELRIIVNRYLTTVELKDYPKATAMVAPDRRVAYIEYTDDLGSKTTITESEIRSIDVPPEGERVEDAPLIATVLVSYNYFRLPSTTVKREVKVQKWIFDEDRKRWLLLEGW